MEIKINTASLETLIVFYNKNNDVFNPPLSTQIHSIEEYVQKLKSNAVIFEAWVSNELAGFIAGYFNDFETKTGFITSVIVSKKNQKQGIAKILLKNTIDYAKENGFKSIKLEVHNENISAINLYKNFGFAENAKVFISMELCV